MGRAITIVGLATCMYFSAVILVMLLDYIFGIDHDIAAAAVFIVQVAALITMISWGAEK